MRCRALIHVAGPKGAGKTALIERLLSARLGLALCVRAERDADLRTEKSTAPATHAELRRYRQAGAASVVRYRFGTPSTDAFFSSDAMQDYSELVVIEGDCPVEFVDLEVFVAPPLPQGQPLLRREKVQRSERRSEQHRRRLLGDGMRDFGLPWPGWGGSDAQELMDLLGKRHGKRGATRMREAWTLAQGYEGIELAQLVVANLRSDDDRAAAPSLLAEVAQLRSDKGIFADVIGIGGKRVPVTAIATDLAGPVDAGWKKVVARVKRTMKQAEG